MRADFWRGRRVLVTGHTGFKGTWLCLWLIRLGAKVTGIALPPTTQPNLFELVRLAACLDSHFCDIREAEPLTALIRASRPEVVFHLAAQPLVRASYRDPVSTFATNVLGTVHVLDALRGLECVRVAVMITTDKVYMQRAWPYPYREADALGGHDPYSGSKAASELVIASYREAYLKAQGVAVASARAGNVIGGGDWAEDRLIPDIIRAWLAGQTLIVRNPQATRPWQHVLEPLYGYLTLAERLWHQPELAGAYNFGPHPHEVATVREVVELARAVFGAGDVRYGDDNQGPREATWLALDTGKARRVLALAPKWGLAETVRRTILWYRAQQAGEDARAQCLTEIAQYEAAHVSTAGP